MTKKLADVVMLYVSAGFTGLFVALYAAGESPKYLGVGIFMAFIALWSLADVVIPRAIRLEVDK